MRARSVAVWAAGVIAILSVGLAPAQAQTVGPLANTTVGNARLIVPDGSSVRQSISTGETRWFVFGAEPGKTYVVEAVDPDSDLVSDTIGALNVYAADGTTTPPVETNVDCTAGTRAPALEVPVAVDGMRCVVRAFPPSPGNTQNKRGLYVAVGSVSGPSFAIRVRESTIYGRWTTNGYDFHVELENTTGDAMCAEVIFLPNAGETYSGAWSGGLTRLQLTVPAFGANKLVFPNGTLVNADNKGTLRIGACPSPVNFVPTSLHVSTFAYNPLTDKFLYYFTNAANNGATANSFSGASGSGTVTNIATGPGLTGGPITASGTINLAGTQLLPTVACATNQVPQWNGSAWICGSGGGSLRGSGTAGSLPLWTGTATLGNSLVRQASGNVGVSVTASVQNQLQVGDTPGLSGNQLALGNGAQAMSFSLTPSATTWYSSTSFALRSTILGGDAHAGIGGTPTHNLDVFGGNAQIGLVNTSNSTSATISKYTNRMEVSPIDAFQVSVGGLANPHFWIGANGNVGVGNTAPANHVEIGSAPGFSGNDLALGNGTKGMSFFQTNTVSNWYSSTNFALMPNTGNGYVGIGTQSPANRLQVGSVGASSYGGYDIAFGNGGGASGFSQASTFVRWDSNTNIALMPVNGAGRVGINTTAPFATLDVEGSFFTGDGFAYFRNIDSILQHCTSCGGNISIWASDNVAALEFDARSDARIKNVVGVSESSRDLATLSALQVTDYTLKDVVRNGAKPFKKVIAQQVEKVYPQVVSQHVDFIPNVYRTASAVTKIAAGTLLHFNNAHGLSPGAKRLKLLTSGANTMQQVGIVSIPSDRDVVIDVPQLNGDKVFVYGEEVNDFRTIDYEGLTTLNISATQEIAKRLVKQQADLAALVADKDAQVAELREQLAKQQARVAELESLAADMSEIRAQLAALKRNAKADPRHDAALRR